MEKGETKVFLLDKIDIETFFTVLEKVSIKSKHNKTYTSIMCLMRIRRSRIERARISKCCAKSRGPLQRKLCKPACCRKRACCPKSAVWKREKESEMRGRVHLLLQRNPKNNHIDLFEIEKINK